MNSLIEASIGLYIDGNNKYYLQVIPSDTEEQFLISITIDEATSIAQREDLIIDSLDD